MWWFETRELNERLRMNEGKRKWRTSGWKSPPVWNRTRSLPLSWGSGSPLHGPTLSLWFSHSDPDDYFSQLINWFVSLDSKRMIIDIVLDHRTQTTATWNGLVLLRDRNFHQWRDKETVNMLLCLLFPSHNTSYYLRGEQKMPLKNAYCTLTESAAHGTLKRSTKECLHKPHYNYWIWRC